MLQPNKTLPEAIDPLHAVTEPHVVVFDMDETLGHFHLIRLIWESLHKFIVFNRIPYRIDQGDFDALLDMFPEMLRPEIISILSILHEKKDDGSCSRVMIYTNNKYSKEWVYLIINYIERKLGGRQLFDNIVLAFKYKGKVQELLRTSKKKKYIDFVSCCKLPSDVKICYFDNTVFPEMERDNVYYLKVRAYCYTFGEAEVRKRIIVPPFLERVLCMALPQHSDIFVQFLIKNLLRKKYVFREKSFLDYEMDKVTSKRIRTHLNTFFGVRMDLPICS